MGHEIFKRGDKQKRVRKGENEKQKAKGGLIVVPEVQAPDVQGPEVGPQRFGTQEWGTKKP